MKEPKWKKLDPTSIGVFEMLAGKLCYKGLVFDVSCIMGRKLDSKRPGNTSRQSVDWELTQLSRCKDRRTRNDPPGQITT